jgi:8-oxo-dGTP pyrophosphatase MutT (NUDIX family)
MRSQFGALPYRFTQSGELQILLITSRRTRRWIIPKGWPMKGMKPARSAEREAFEEAGIRGKIAARAIGTFVYDKVLDDDDWAVPCEVMVFPLLVKRQLKTWPEQHQRESRWFDPSEVYSLINDQGLFKLIAAFVSQCESRRGY